MQDVRRWSRAEDEQEEADRQTASLAGMAFALALVAAGLYLTHHLHAKAAVEDCLLAGRLNCDAVVTAEAP